MKSGIAIALGVAVWLVAVMLPITPIVADEFIISVTTGEDDEPPTTPTILSVTPVAATQIDIVWGAATDNVLVAGYVLSRNGAPIATTTALTFADSGLLPETLYEYTVRAFDTSGNISSSSLPIATTTLSLPPPVATSTPIESAGGGSATAVLSRLERLTISTTQTSATVMINTERPTQFIIRWGETPGYEQASIRTEAFATEYSYEWTGLQPGTKYFLEVIGVNPRGLETVLYVGSFTTDSIVSDRLVPNVTSFTATVQADGTIALVWTLPPDIPAESEVRVLRNERQFPSRLEDGVLVYQGRRGSVVDKDIDWSEIQRTFYTIFVLLPSGEASSGVVTVVMREDQAVGIGEKLPLVVPEATSTVIFARPETRLPGLVDIVFAHKNTSHTFLDSGVAVPAGAMVLVRVPVDSAAPHLKSIVVTFSGAEGTSLAYLLRLDETGQWYEGLVVAPALPGEWRMVVTIYDFEAAVVGRYQTVIMISDIATIIEPARIEGRIQHIYEWSQWGLIGLFVLLIYILRRQRKLLQREDK